MPPIVIAHRTCPLDAPENSLRGIDACRSRGADVAEIDVRLTSDGMPVLLHDRSLRRTTGVRRAVADTTHAELRDLRLEGTEERIPTFAEVLGGLDDGLRIAIDVKDPAAADAVLDEIADQRAEAKVLFWAQSVGAVRRAVERAPEIETALLRDARHPGAITGLLDDATACGADAISAHWWSVGDRFAERARERGLVLYAWCKSPRIDPATLGRLDGVVTDWPEIARTLVGSAGPVPD